MRKRVTSWKEKARAARVEEPEPWEEASSSPAPREKRTVALSASCSRGGREREGQALQ